MGGEGEEGGSCGVTNSRSSQRPRLLKPRLREKASAARLSRTKADHCPHPMRQPLLGPANAENAENTDNTENTAELSFSERGTECAPVMRRSRSMRDLLEPDRPGGSPRIFKACMPMYLALFLPVFSVRCAHAKCVPQICHCCRLLCHSRFCLRSVRRPPLRPLCSLPNVILVPPPPHPPFSAVFEFSDPANSIVRDVNYGIYSMLR